VLVEKVLFLLWKLREKMKDNMNKGMKRIRGVKKDIVRERRNRMMGR
jgi:hypothetical protein